MSVALGIDTGGTYTDAVLVEYEANQVLATAKALTTKQDLSIGIRKAIDRVLALCPADVRLVSLSTTLATNAIVEGNGAPICALLIGYPDHLQHNPDLKPRAGHLTLCLHPRRPHHHGRGAGAARSRRCARGHRAARALCAGLCRLRLLWHA